MLLCDSRLARVLSTRYTQVKLVGMVSPVGLMFTQPSLFLNVLNGIWVVSLSHF